MFLEVIERPVAWNLLINGNKWLKIINCWSHAILKQVIIFWTDCYQVERSYEIITENYFCVCHKNRRKRNQHFKLLFFKINLHFGTSDYISTDGKLNLLPINSVFLVFPSREMQRRLMQTKVYYKLSLFNLKRSLKKSCKKVFPKCVYHWYNFLRWMFFNPCDNCKQYFLHKFIITQRLHATMLLRSFKQVFWKTSAFYIHYLHNNTKMMLISKGSKWSF